MLGWLWPLHTCLRERGVSSRLVAPPAASAHGGAGAPGVRDEQGPAGGAAGVLPAANTGEAVGRPRPGLGRGSCADFGLAAAVATAWIPGSAPALTLSLGMGEALALRALQAWRGVWAVAPCTRHCTQCSGQGPRAQTAARRAEASVLSLLFLARLPLGALCSKPTGRGRPDGSGRRRLKTEAPLRVKT